MNNVLQNHVKKLTNLRISAKLCPKYKFGIDFV